MIVQISLIVFNATFRPMFCFRFSPINSANTENNVIWFSAKTTLMTDYLDSN